MKNNILKFLVFAISLVVLGGCAVFKNKPIEYAIDPVCNMKIQKSESYKWKYENERYYFDSYTCKQSFMMNPNNFLGDKCATPK
jgi:YHS domain-containing protein